MWRDDELPPHRAYADVIEERLRSAKAVVVLWSAEAAKSQWVRAEADMARAVGNAGPGDSRRHHSAAAVQPDPVRGPSGWDGHRHARLAQAQGQRHRARRGAAKPTPPDRRKRRAHVASACCRSRT